MMTATEKRAPLGAEMIGQREALDELVRLEAERLHESDASIRERAEKLAMLVRVLDLSPSTPLCATDRRALLAIAEGNRDEAIRDKEAGERELRAYEQGDSDCGFHGLTHGENVAEHRHQIGEALAAASRYAAIVVLCCPIAVRLSDAEAETLRWLAGHRALGVEDAVDLHTGDKGESPAQRLEVRSNQYRILSELLTWADERSVDQERVALLLGMLRIARADRKQLLAEDRDAVAEHGIDVGDVENHEQRIASIEALMESLGDDPHAPPRKGGDA